MLKRRHRAQQRGGNGENTIDVKDSHDVVIRGNRAVNDAEYNIVVHGVDSVRSTYGVAVEANHCQRGGQAKELSAGIALLFVRGCRVSNNLVEQAYGEGILVHDAELDSDNDISSNACFHNGLQQRSEPIVLERSLGTRVNGNFVDVPAPLSLPR